MESAPNPIVAFIPLILMMIPILIVNIVISNRKGKNPTMYGLLSLIPIVSVALLFFLVSITDKDVYEKLDDILKILDSNQKSNST